jgi:hypothetical protein
MKGRTTTAPRRESNGSERRHVAVENSKCFRVPIVEGGSLKRKARREGRPDNLDIDDQIPGQTVESPYLQHERGQRLLAAAALLAVQVRQLPLRHPMRGRYVNALQALMAGESGDVGRIAFLTTNPVAKTREELRSLADTGIASVEVDEIGLVHYSCAEFPVE